MVELTFRRAQPDDVAAAVPLIYSSGPRAFDWVFGYEGFCSAQDFLNSAFRQGRSLFGHQNHTVAVRAGQVIGSIAFFTRKDAKAFTRGTVFDIFGHYGFWRGLRISRRGLRIERSLPPPLEGRLYIAHVGVREDLRSHGIGGAMLLHAIESRGNTDHLIPALDVAVTNPRAQALYERLGFVVVREMPPPDDTVPAHRYMERPLDR